LLRQRPVTRKYCKRRSVYGCPRNRPWPGFFTGKKFPTKYQDGLFSAQHGSWNRTDPIGAQIVFASLKDDGSADKTELFADSWLDPFAGKERAAECANCLGPLGLSQLPKAPHPAGQPALYVVEQLKNCQSSKRRHEIMNFMTKLLTDLGVEDLAAGYESIQITVTIK
jgi:cytochrome c553